MTLSTVIIPHKFPLYKQCDPRWGSQVMEPPITVCQAGCLMSSTSMALNGYGIGINGSVADPGTFNQWLRTHDGYTKESDFIETVISNLSPRAHYVGPFPPSFSRQEIESKLSQKGTIMIANVMHGHHFVLVTGWNTSMPSSWLVNDPGFNRNYYDNSDIVGWRIFHFD